MAMRIVTAFFDEYEAAKQAVYDLELAGIGSSDISIVAGNADRRDLPEPAISEGTGAARGASIGGVVGGGAGLLAGLGVLTLPGIGPVIAAGWLATTALGAAVGAATGGLIGALTDAGLSEDEAEYYAEGIRRGGTLVMIRSDAAMADKAAQIMNRAGAADIKRRGAEWSSASTSAAQQRTATAMQGAGNMSQQPGQQRMSHKEGEIRVPVVEEELKVGKRENAAAAGGVRVESRVTEKPVEQKVQLHEEHVSVERRPTNRPASSADLSNQKGETFEVREHREEPVVQKTARVVEEVVVSKEERDRTETIRDTVRRKDVDVKPIGHRGEDDSIFREDYQKSYANSGLSFEQCAPAYRYGSELTQRHQGRQWTEIESDARRDWESRSPGTWDKMKNAVRHGWERMKGNAQKSAY